MRTEQDKINRKEANQRYYKLEENKEQKSGFLLFDNFKLVARCSKYDFWIPGNILS